MGLFKDEITKIEVKSENVDLIMKMEDVKQELADPEQWCREEIIELQRQIEGIIDRLNEDGERDHSHELESMNQAYGFLVGLLVCRGE